MTGSLMTFRDQWRRGAVMCFIIGLVGLVAVAVSASVVSILLLPIELLLFKAPAAAIEDSVQHLGTAILTIVLFPAFLSQAQKQISIVR
jgi:hypothetical protein